MSETKLIASRYELGSLIGRGAMGSVYRGSDLQSGDVVAIKVLRPELTYGQPELVERFRREAETLARLNHPNIVKVLTTDQADNLHYLVMEYVPGGTLADLLKQQPQLPLERALAIGLELSDALTRTHHLNIVHRDIKPANILIAADGTPRLTDFGLAFSSSERRLTQPGLTVGTWLYLSPELMAGATPDARSDVWAFGIVLYEMLAGRTPFSGDSLPAIAQDILNAPLLSPTAFREDIPRDLERLIQQLLAKNPAARLSSFRQIGARLESIAAGSSVDTASARIEPAQADESVTIEVQWTDETPVVEHDSQQRLLSKLSQPQPRAQFVPRVPLQNKLEASITREGRVTLVIAPAGFGKTTAISAWLNASEHRAAWYTLDASDNDPVQFLRYLIAALQRLDPPIGATTYQLLQSPVLPPIAALLTPLLNDVGRVHPLILVLDDYHHLSNPAVHEGVQFVLDHQPPSLHLVIVTREALPLKIARLRVRDQLTVIGERDLRFAPEDAAQFLNHTMKLALSSEQIARLDERIEGWIAGLQLAGLALRDNQDQIEPIVASFTGDHPYVADYLMGEVLDSLPEPVRAFLRQTSILDRFNASLCQAVTNNPDSSVLLEQLDHGNLFVLPVTTNRAWYRYYQFFAEALRQTLTADESAQLHRRAAAWFDREGAPAEAIRHALAAAAIDGNYRPAMERIRRVIDHYIEDGRLVTILGWLNAFSDETLRSDLALAIDKAWVYAVMGDVDRAATYLESAEAGLDRSHVEAVDYGKLRLVQATLALAHADLPGAIEHASEAGRLLDAEGGHWELLALWTLAEAQERGGPIDHAVATLRAAYTLAGSARQSFMQAMIAASLAHALNVSGQRQAAQELCEQFIAGSRDPGHTSPMTAVILTQLMFALYDADQLDRAETIHRQARELSEQLSLGLITAVADGQEAMLQFARGELDEALVSVRSALKRIDHPGLADVTWISALEGAIHLERGDIAAAQAWADRLGLTPDDELHYLHLEQHVAFAQLLIRQGKSIDAARWLSRLEAFVTERGYARWLIAVDILKALLAVQSGERDDARSILSRAVHLAQPQDYRRLFVDQGAEIAELLSEIQTEAPDFIGAIRQTSGAALDTSVARSLSSREAEILRLIADGVSNAEIGRRLSLAGGTLMQHMGALYGQLGVQTRRQATALARKLSRSNPDAR